MNGTRAEAEISGLFVFCMRRGQIGGWGGGLSTQWFPVSLWYSTQYNTPTHTRIHTTADSLVSWVPMSTSWQWKLHSWCSVSHLDSFTQAHLRVDGESGTRLSGSVETNYPNQGGSASATQYTDSLSICCSIRHQYFDTLKFTWGELLFFRKIILEESQTTANLNERWRRRREWANEKMNHKFLFIWSFLQEPELRFLPLWFPTNSQKHTCCHVFVAKHPVVLTLFALCFGGEHWIFQCWMMCTTHVWILRKRIWISHYKITSTWGHF